MLCQWESGVCRVLGADGGLYDRQCGSICRPPDRAADICRYLTGWRRCDNGNGHPVLNSLKDIVLYALKVLYFIAFTYLTGTTLGKKAMNLRVVSKNPEEKLTLFNVVYRETVGRFLCSLPVNIGYIVAGIDSEKRGFHDLLCDTRVVYQKKIKAWMAQPGTVVPECEKPNVEEQKPQTSEGELSKTQENVQMKESGIRELKKTENTQSSVVEKLGKPVYNGYRLVENKSEKEIASNATVNENISEKDT